MEDSHWIADSLTQCSLAPLGEGVSLPTFLHITSHYTAFLGNAWDTTWKEDYLPLYSTCSTAGYHTLPACWVSPLPFSSHIDTFSSTTVFYHATISALYVFSSPGGTLHCTCNAILWLLEADSLEMHYLGEVILYTGEGYNHGITIALFQVLRLTYSLTAVTNTLLTDLGWFLFCRYWGLLG